MTTKLFGARIALALVTSMAATAHAVSIDFSGAQYATSAVAIAGTQADAQSAQTPASALPLTSAATAIGANDFADAYANAAAGLLTAGADALSFTGSSGASGFSEASMLATVFGSGRLTLNFAFNDPDGTDGTQYFLLVTNTLGNATTQLFSGLLDPAGLRSLTFFAPGTTSTVQLIVDDQASTSADGTSASGFAQVAVTGTIPAPETLPLMVGGLTGLFVMRRRASPKRST